VGTNIKSTVVKSSCLERRKTLTRIRGNQGVIVTASGRIIIFGRRGTKTCIVKRWRCVIGWTRGLINLILEVASGRFLLGGLGNTRGHLERLS
jgi:hypothetical protein